MAHRAAFWPLGACDLGDHVEGPAASHDGGDGAVVLGHGQAPGVEGGARAAAVATCRRAWPKPALRHLVQRRGLHQHQGRLLRQAHAHAREEGYDLRMSIQTLR